MGLKSIIINLFSGMLLCVSALLFLYGEYAYIVERGNVNAPGTDSFGCVIAMGFFVVCVVLIGIALCLIPRDQKIRTLTYLGWGFLIATVIYCWVGFQTPGPNYVLDFFWYTEWINPVMGVILLKTAGWLKKETSAGVIGPQSVFKPQPVDPSSIPDGKFESTNTTVSQQVSEAMRDLSGWEEYPDPSLKFSWAAVVFIGLWVGFYIYKMVMIDEVSLVLNMLLYGFLLGFIACIVEAFRQSARYKKTLPVFNALIAERDSIRVQVDKYDEQLDTLLKSWGPDAQISDSQNRDFEDRMNARDELWKKYLELDERIRKILQNL